MIKISLNNVCQEMKYNEVRNAYQNRTSLENDISNINMPHCEKIIWIKSMQKSYEKLNNDFLILRSLAWNKNSQRCTYYYKITKNWKEYKNSLLLHHGKEWKIVVKIKRSINSMLSQKL